MAQAAVIETFDWRERAFAALQKEAESGRRFDAVDLQERHKLPDPPHGNSWGALFQSAARREIIHIVAHHKSRRPSRAGGICAIWQGHPSLRGMLL